MAAPNLTVLDNQPDAAGGSLCCSQRSWQLILTVSSGDEGTLKGAMVCHTLKAPIQLLRLATVEQPKRRPSRVHRARGCDGTGNNAKR